MSLLVVGSIALDSVSTPFGEREDALGGAASFFAVAARLYGGVRLVGVIGDDFPEAHVRTFEERAIDLEGLERRPGARTFRWSGRYEGRMDAAETRWTELNVLGAFRPELPASYRDSRFAFLANGDPVTQRYVREQLTSAEFVLLDTMNFWIEKSRDRLWEAIRTVDGVIMNDDEARALGGSGNLIRAMQNVARQGVGTLIVKKGEHGAVLLRHGELFALPAFPLEEVRDPTGAGDSFAAGVMGRLAAARDFSFQGFKTALAHGMVVASFTVEDFGLERLLRVTREELDRRLEAYFAFVRF